MENYTRELIAVVALLAVTAGAILLLDQPVERPYTASFPGSDAPDLKLEVADTREERRKGLMNRRSLEKNTGMLFIFPGEEKRGFWMKNTYIPLDIIFIDANKTVVKIHEADPQPNATEDELKIYRSGSPAKYVIEIEQDFSDRYGIETGDRVVIEN